PSTNAVLQSSLRADYIVTPSSFAQDGFTTDLAARLASNPTFRSVSEIRQGFAGVGGSTTQVQAIDPSSILGVFNLDMTAGSVSGLGDDGLLVDRTTANNKGWRMGRVVSLRFTQTGVQPFHIVGIYDNNPL